MVNDAYSFPVLPTMVKTEVYVKPNMSETTSYVKLGVVDIVLGFFLLRL